MTAARKDPVWSSQFSVMSSAKTPHLRGDKVVLPPSALQELFTAATVTVSPVAYSLTSNFDPYNRHTYAAEREARRENLETEQQLPHPLTFRLVNPKNGRVTFAGVREFSADDQCIGLSPFLRDTLGVEDPKTGNGFGQTDSIREDQEQPSDGETPRITVHLKVLQKGTYVKLRPLEAGYEAEDWKALFTRYLRDTFTTLTKGEILSIPAGSQDFRYLVDELSPSDEAVSIIDTNLEVDVEALNEEQARESLSKALQRENRPPGSSYGSSRGGLVKLNKLELGQVGLGDYVDYTLPMNNSKNPFEILEVQLEIDPDDDGVDLFISPFGPRQRSKPRQNEYVFGDISAASGKKIRIPNTHPALENADSLLISVRGYKDPDMMQEDDSKEHVMPYELDIVRVAPVSDSSLWSDGTIPSSTPSVEEDFCENCQRWVPRKTMAIHENFCQRHNTVCLLCKNAFQISSDHWKNHWHCPIEDAYGNTEASQRKHHVLFHTPQSCASCNHPFLTVPDLAEHRTTTCPDKLILCKFCHLEVPQQGVGDPDINDPAVILSGLTPHEYIDGARTTECHLCDKIERLRDMPAHLKLHDLERRSLPKPRVCRNVNCGRIVNGMGKNGQAKRQPLRNELGLCDICFGPLYVAMHDPDGKALKRRVERKYLTQLLTGCGQTWCRNEYCKTNRQHLGLVKPEKPITMKEALIKIKPMVEKYKDDSTLVHFCTDEASQRRRALAEMVSTEGRAGAGSDDDSERGGDGYVLEWCVAALEVEAGKLDEARAWLRVRAPTREDIARSQFGEKAMEA